MATFTTLSADGLTYRIIDLPAIAGGRLRHLPYIHRILLENVMRTAPHREAERARPAILDWTETGTSESEISFLPGRVLMHDTTCGPALVDIAGLRDTLAEMGGDPTRLNPVLPVEVSTDHSVAVDVFGSPDALRRNMEQEFARNAERYRLMKWATNALSGLRVHPPGTGIMHTLNLERIATVVATSKQGDVVWAFPDTLIGTDSHTPMINGIGVLGWGVGGLEAESVMFGMPVTMRVPEVIGVYLSGRLRPGVLATDLALTVTERLRRLDLAGRFVEFVGPGVSTLSAGERAAVANMAPEFGANSGYFPIDAATLDYLRATGRGDAQVRLVETYARCQSMWFDPSDVPRYTERVDIDLNEVETSVAGPRRPQDRIAAGDTAKALAPLLRKPATAGQQDAPGDGAVAIAAITSCTNTSDASLIIAAGLLAQKAARMGLKPPRWVKTSLAPGSPTAEAYLRRAGLLEPLEALGFGIVGYGCTTCIGNSGPLTAEIDEAMTQNGILPVAVISGNRNFPGRVHPRLEAGFLASPPLVVAFALAGDVTRNIIEDPIGCAQDGREVRLADLWPSAQEVESTLAMATSAADFDVCYGTAETSEMWRDLDAPQAPLFPWNERSTYVRRPPFAGLGDGTRLGCFEAHPLLVLGDDITTDHISPAGQIGRGSEAARHLADGGENPNDLNVFAARRGNWEVMLRGLFTNRTLRNLLMPAAAPGSTIIAGSHQELPLWQAAAHYAQAGISTVIVAGARYGMGSSRDWAAKGVALLGVRAVLAVGFERIHRSNLIGMGVLPILLPEGATPQRLALSVDDRIVIDAPPHELTPRARLKVKIVGSKGAVEILEVRAAVETSAEMDTLKAGGILPLILKNNLLDAAA